MIGLLCICPADSRAADPLPDPAVSSETGTGANGRGARLLAEMIRIPTVNPPGNERPLAERIARELDVPGIETRVIATPSGEAEKGGRAAVWARLAGNGAERPLILLSHLDVVPANPENWTHDPFAGEIDQGWIWGRGALDAKGVAAIQILSLLRLARRETPLERDITLLATPDEETGGLDGAGFLVREHPELLAEAEFLVTEGGGVRGSREARGDLPRIPPIWSVSVTEKSPCWLELETRGRAGHGSTPRPAAAVPRLIAALDRVRRVESPVRVLAEVEAMFLALSENASREDREGFRSLAQSLESEAAFRRRFLARPGYNALVRNTLSITVLSAGSGTNVVPAEARARLDARLLPGENCADFSRTLSEVIGDPEVGIRTLLSFPSRSSSAESALFRAIENVARRHDEDAIVVPRMISGFTDAHWFREAGVVSYGFVPRWLNPGDARGVHGIDERISIENIEGGASILVEIIEELAAKNSPGSRSLNDSR